MAINVQCSCGAAFQVGDNLAGKRVRCARCQNAVDVPAQETHDAAYWNNIHAKGQKKAARAAFTASPRISTKVKLIIGGSVVVLGGVILSIVLLSSRKSGTPTETSPVVAATTKGIDLEFKIEGVKPEFERALRSQYLTRLKAAGIGENSEVKVTIEGKTVIRNRQFQPLDADDDPKGSPENIKVPVVESKFIFENSTGRRMIYDVQFIGAAPPETPMNEAIIKVTEEASWRGFSERIFMVPVPAADVIDSKGPPPPMTVTKIDLATEFARSPESPSRIERYLYLVLSRSLWSDLKLTKEQRIELGMLKSEFGGAGKGREISPGPWKIADLHVFFRDISRSIRGLLTAEQIAQFQKLYESKSLALPVVTIKERKLPPGQSDASHLLACVDYKIVATPYGESLGWPPMAPIAMDIVEAQDASLEQAETESYAIPNAEIKSPQEIIPLLNSNRKLVKLFAIHWISTHDTGQASAEIAADLKKSFGPSWKDYFARDHDEIDDAKVFAYIAALTGADMQELAAISQYSGGVWNRIGIAARGKLFRDCFDDLKKSALAEVQQGKRPPIWDVAIWYRDEGKRNPNNVDPLSVAKAAELVKALNDAAAEMKAAATRPKP